MSWCALPHCQPHLAWLAGGLLFFFLKFLPIHGGCRIWTLLPHMAGKETFIYFFTHAAQWCLFQGCSAGPAMTQGCTVELLSSLPWRCEGPCAAPNSLHGATSGCRSASNASPCMPAVKWPAAFPHSQQTCPACPLTLQAPTGLAAGVRAMHPPSMPPVMLQACPCLLKGVYLEVPQGVCGLPAPLQEVHGEQCLATGAQAMHPCMPLMKVRGAHIALLPHHPTVSMEWCLARSMSNASRHACHEGKRGPHAATYSLHGVTVCHRSASNACHGDAVRGAHGRPALHVHPKFQVSRGRLRQGAEWPSSPRVCDGGELSEEPGGQLSRCSRRSLPRSVLHLWLAALDVTWHIYSCLHCSTGDNAVHLQSSRQVLPTLG